jgi:hypothetical protein
MSSYVSTSSYKEIPIIIRRGIRISGRALLALTIA